MFLCHGKPVIFILVSERMFEINFFHTRLSLNFSVFQHDAPCENYNCKGLSCGQRNSSCW